jgi:hypothetical protein
VEVVVEVFGGSAVVHREQMGAYLARARWANGRRVQAENAWQNLSLAIRATGAVH